MTTKLLGASIVIIAEAHNPSILSPTWLKENKVLTEKPLKFVLTPDFAVFDSKNYYLVVDRQRLQLNAKKPATKSIQQLSTSITRYLELLPHIPFLKLGLNFDWIVESDDKTTVPEIKVKIGTKNDFNSIIPDHTLCFGSKIIAESKDYTLKIAVEPTEEDALIYKFNFEFNLKEVDVTEIIGFVNNYQDLKSFANKIVNQTISQG